MTTLLFTIDLIKERVGISKMTNTETQVFFDEENMSTPEEILNTKMEEVLIRRVGDENPFTDVYEQLQETDQIILNNKEQLLRVVPMIKNGRKVDIHNILSFDVSKLPQAKLHDYTGGQGDELDFAFA